MNLEAMVTDTGTLQTNIPQMFWGKKVMVSITALEERETSNWKNIKAALDKVEQLNLPGRPIEAILAELRVFRETE